MSKQEPENSAVIEAEQFLKSLRNPDLTYEDVAYVDGEIGDWVAVSTWGAADELTENDEPETMPVRLRVGSEDGDEAEAYLSIKEAEAVRKLLAKAIKRAKTFPQPGSQDR